MEAALARTCTWNAGRGQEGAVYVWSCRLGEGKPPSNAALERLPRGAHAQRAFSTAGPAVRNRV